MIWLQRNFIYITKSRQRAAICQRYKEKISYSWSKICWGECSSPMPWTRGNLVFLSISMTSEFLRSSSPSFCPEVRWLQTKQKLVWCKDMLIEIEPCKKKHIPSSYISLNSCLIEGSQSTKVYFPKYSSTLFPRYPINPLPTHDTFIFWTSFLRSLLTQTVRNIPTICLLATIQYFDWPPCLSVSSMGKLPL